MAPEDEGAQTGTEAAGGAAKTATSGGLGTPLVIAATLVLGAAAALGAKALLDSRRKGSSEDENEGAGEATQSSNQDLPAVLREAALDLAIAATSQAAERLGREPDTSSGG